MNKLAFAAVALAAVATSGLAQAKVIRCDTCTTDQQFKAVAVTLGWGDNYVYNLENNTLQYWRVPYSDSGTNPDSGGTMATGRTPNTRATVSANPPVKLTAPAHALNELSKAHTLYVIGGGTLRPIINAPISSINLPIARNKTVYDVVQDQNIKGQVESAAGSIETITTVASAGLLNALADLTNIANSALGLTDQAALLIRLVMSDGSYVDIRVVLSSTTGDILEESARTASGQVIPTTLDQVQGTWGSGGGDNLYLLVHHMEILGATMAYDGPGGAGGKYLAIVCTGSGSSKNCVVTVSLQ